MLELYIEAAGLVKKLSLGKRCFMLKLSSKNKSPQFKFVARITTSFLVPLPLHRDREDPGNEVSFTREF